jgi:hypothetical protein
MKLDKEAKKKKDREGWKINRNILKVVQMQRGGEKRPLRCIHENQVIVDDKHTRNK